MSDNKIAESLYKTYVSRIKVLEKQVNILTEIIQKRKCPDSRRGSENKCHASDNCTECWQEWSLEKAQKEVAK